MYNNFIGIDIGKFEFVVSLNCSKQVSTFSNTETGIKEFIKAYEAPLADGLSVLEATGGYELQLLLTMSDKGYALHRANTRHVKHFIRSYGNGAKTDSLDSQALSRFGKERHASLKIFEHQSKRAIDLYGLVQRRKDLKAFEVAENNRSQAPNIGIHVQKSCATVLKCIREELAIIEKEIASLIDEEVSLKAKKTCLKTIPGIGEVSANSLIALLPELGTVNRSQIASLVGLAPIPKDSGKYFGYRSVGYGRAGIKETLFMCAMAARRSNSPLKNFYERLIEAGKPKKVALTAVMRKLIVIANAKLKELAEKPA
jgi:transposase